MISIKVGKLTFKVELVDDFDSVGQFGMCIYKTQTIKLLKTLSKEQLKATLIHELVHATMYVNGLSENETFNKEQLCEFLAWHSEKIIDMANKIMKELKDEHKD